MVNVVYPNGTKAFQTIVSSYPLTASPVAVGSMEFGDGKILSQTHAPGIVLAFTVVKNSSTTLVMTFETSPDGMNWSAIDEYAYGMTIPAGTTEFRLHLQPFTRDVGRMRILLSTGSVGTDAATVTIRGRLSGSYPVYTAA
jgi:hypothetical protein